MLFRSDVRGFAHAAISRNSAWFGAYLDLHDGGALVSMSPELFLRARPDGTVVTRPIKGTRPAQVAADAMASSMASSMAPSMADELMASAKDAAELAMIVDLMRNDLGRVAEVGTVAVTEGRVLETHSTVHHGVEIGRAHV